MSENLKKLAQEKLAQAHTLLKEAGDLADRGGFHLTFWGGGSYAPKIGEITPELREEALERLGEDYSVEELAEMTEENRDSLIRDAVMDIVREDLAEYQEPGEWWMPSMC